VAQLGRVGSAAWAVDRSDVLELSPTSFAKKRQRDEDKRPLYKPRPNHQSISSDRDRGRYRRRRSRSHGRRRRDRRSRSYDRRDRRKYSPNRRRKRDYSPRRRESSPKRMYIPPPRRSPERSVRYSPSRREESPPPPDTRKSKALAGHPYQPPTWSDFPARNKMYLFQVIKDGEHILNIPLFQQANFTTFGKDKINEVRVMHPSTSRFHACIQFGRFKQKTPAIFLYDLKSSHGTMINGIRLPPEKFQEIVPGDRVAFGASKRIYLLANGTNVSNLPFIPNDVPQIEKKKQQEAAEWEKELREIESEIGQNPIQRRHKKMLKHMEKIWDWRDPTFNDDRLNYLQHMKTKVGYGRIRTSPT